MQDKDLSGLIEDESFLNYCLGKNAEDIRYWESWLKDNPGQREKIDEIKNLIILLGHEAKEREADEQYQLLRQRIVNPGKASEPLKLLRYPAWLKVAAAAAILIFAAAGFYFTRMKSVQVNPVPINLVETPMIKDHQLIKLADGSTVVLNANSRLKYPRIFNSSTREVTLLGEGYFDIRHDVSHPFIVHTGRFKITVLGTAFNIKAYNHEKKITVTVTRGKVSVSDNAKVLGVITPDHQLSYNKEDNSIVQLPVNSAKTIEWQTRDLFLDDMTMQQAAKVLEQRFNVKIRFSSENVKKCRFTGTFIHGEKLEDILRVICDFNNATYTTSTEGQVVISGAGCAE
ncbi:hypothetical protein BEL04_11095 [Mucilaginibacter sp. PPCGB 2223]|uniref:FecR family protein n=1 Tax=Mucilaginibacter sp. PPCGB 2223 TaxID=1886027 RepID=UPI000825D35E|nr:FecR family protein [Mucilaginibacter sp. PPCGB 2223]OCX52045.1 hypothetical protein BEL04_11095 [Mucilaginibacter sp. PPCGB 2223]